MNCTFDTARIKPFFRKHASIFILFICILVGFLLRTGSLALTDISPESLFLFDTPMLTNIDGYYYLNIARMLLDGSYSATDPLRAFPEGGELPQIAPLLSYLAAYISRILQFDLNWVGSFLPTVLSLLICIPLYGFANRWGDKITVYFSLLVTMTAHTYATRTSFGVMDTDCMNVTFPLLISWCYLKFGVTQNYHRYTYFLLGVIFTGLFLWWWDIAPSIVLAFSLFPLLTSLLIFYRPPTKEGILFFSTILLCISLLLSFVGLEILESRVEHFSKLFLYITKNKALHSTFPNTGISNLEQRGLSFYEIAVNSVGSRVFLIIGLVGILQLITKKKSEFLFLLPILCVGLLSFTSGRLLIFLTPFLGIGLGFFVSTILSFERFKPLTLLGAFCVGAFMLLNSVTDPPIRTSFFSREVISGMHRISKLTPPNAIVYGWWDIGHPLIYWSQRATLADGKIHNGERTVYLAAPLIGDDYRFSANYMQFLGNHGVPGIAKLIDIFKKDQKTGFSLLKNVLAAGPSEGKKHILNSPLASVDPPFPWQSWLEFFFPSNGSPVYFFLEERVLMPSVQRWLYWYGTWDTKLRRGEPVLASIPISAVQYFRGKTKNDIRLDKETGVFTMPQAFKAPIQLSRLTRFYENHLYTATYKQNNYQSKFDYQTGYLPRASEEQYVSLSGKYCLEILPPPLTSMLQDIKLVDSLTKKLFLYKDKNAFRYFRLIDENRLKYQLWQVLGDRIPLTSQNQQKDISSEYK